MATTLDGQVIVNAWRSFVRVTSVIQSAGLVDSSHFSEYAATRGTYLHLATHYYDAGELDESSLDPVILPFLNGYKKFLQETGFVVEESEKRIFSTELGVTGQLDKLGKFPDGRKAIIDLKTGVFIPAHEVQLAAYHLLLGDRKFLKFGLYLTKEGNYKLIQMLSKDARDVFLAALKVYAWKEATK